jgi:hypothetical protein
LFNFALKSETMPSRTETQYAERRAACRQLFERKTIDYGTAWRVLRPSSLTDQIFIKAQRIRTIEENGSQKVADGIEDEFVGIVNYCIMALIQLELPKDAPLELGAAEALALYDKHYEQTYQLMMAKNHDYGEAWRDMRISSFTDLILMKLLRVKQIEDNQGKTLVSEGLDANYADMINYAMFGLIKIHE